MPITDAISVSLYLYIHKYAFTITQKPTPKEPAKPGSRKEGLLDYEAGRGVYKRLSRPGPVYLAGLLRQATGIDMRATTLGSCLRRSPFLRWRAEVNHSRSLPIKALMPASFVVELEIGGKPLPRFRHRAIGLQVNADGHFKRLAYDFRFLRQRHVAPVPISLALTERPLSPIQNAP